MPKRPDETFPLPSPEAPADIVLDLLGGMVRRRPLSGEEALKREAELGEAARAGDAAAQAHLARIVLAREPNAEGNRRAVRLLRRSARKKHPDGLYLLGLLALRGQGMKRNPELGRSLLEEAAYQNHRAAQSALARAFELGAGGPKDPERALYWRRLAASLGSSADALEAGRAYRDGRGASENMQEARRWLTRAAKAGNGEAQYEAALLLRRRLTDDEAAAESQRWMKEAALSGIPDAQFRTGLAAWSGEGGRVNLGEALRWLKRAAAGGSARAALMIAGFFLTGNALPLDRPRAYAALRAAERLGDPEARRTADAVRSGLDPEEAREIERRAGTEPLGDFFSELLSPWIR